MVLLHEEINQEEKGHILNFQKKKKKAVTKRK